MRTPRTSRPWLNELLAEARRPDFVMPASDWCELEIALTTWRALPQWFRTDAELVGRNSRRTGEGLEKIAFETTTGRAKDWMARLTAEGFAL